MPKAVYTSPDFAKAEEEHIFAKEWLCAGRADALPNPGDYLTMVIAGEPVIILRDRDGVLRGMSNVCRHRMSTLLEGRGNVRSIVCPYHAWTYNLDGSLRGAPGDGAERGVLQGGRKAACGPRRGLAGLDHGHAVTPMRRRWQSGWRGWTGW
jgi:phenylpropionate dioxygenase-like ring-hydroxylating dioxygenase large terminal subunit